MLKTIRWLTQGHKAVVIFEHAISVLYITCIETND